MISNPAIPRGLSIHDSQEPAYAKPDFSQMIPFKPKVKYVPGEHPISGGAFPPPPALANLLSLLPPPKCFRGPFVKIDNLVDLFMKINLPDQGGQWSTATGHDVRLFELSKSVHWVVDSSGERKRRIVLGEDSDDEDGNKPLLTSDIYRARQQKKMKTTA